MTYIVYWSSGQCEEVPASELAQVLAQSQVEEERIESFEAVPAPLSELDMMM